MNGIIIGKFHRSATAATKSATHSPMIMAHRATDRMSGRHARRIKPNTTPKAIVMIIAEAFQAFHGDFRVWYKIRYMLFSTDFYSLRKPLIISGAPIRS